MAPLVLIAHNPVPVDADPSTREVLDQVALVAESLTELQGPLEIMEISRPEAPTVSAKSLVFTLYEAGPGEFLAPIRFIRALEEMGVPFTGASSQALALTKNKVVTRECLAQAGMAVAAGSVFPCLPPLPTPVDRQTRMRGRFPRHRWSSTSRGESSTYPFWGAKGKWKSWPWQK